MAKDRRGWRYQRACAEKICYPEQAAAARAVEEIHARLVLTFPDWHLVHYRCRYGRHWHLGHSYIGGRVG